MRADRESLNPGEDDSPRRFSELLVEPHSMDEGVICWLIAHQYELPAARRGLQGAQELRHSF
jgi:hypothetical protein